jgi:hypothetical protein
LTADPAVLPAKKGIASTAPYQHRAMVEAGIDDEREALLLPNKSSTSL